MNQDTSLLDLLPEGILRDYVALWVPTTDAPLIYHIGGALAVVSTLLGKRIYLPYGGIPLYPNLWVLILGPSSSFRKSTIVGKAQATIGDFEPTAIFPEDFSRERFLEHLSEHPQGLLVSSEFGNMLALFSRDYMTGTKEMLSHLYDSPPKYTRVVKDRTLEIDNPVISFFAASQTDWFQNKVHESDMRGGFLARFVFISASAKPESIAFPPEPDAQAKDTLYAGLKSLAEVNGAVELEATARLRYEKWFRAHDKELDVDPKKGTLSPFWARLSSIALKLAMIFQVARDQTLLITDDTMNRALQMTDRLKPSLREVMKAMVFSKEMRQRQEVLDAIHEAGTSGITRRDLLRKLSLLLEDLKPLIDSLKEEGAIREVASQRSTRYFAHSGEDEFAQAA
jgi:hypothetical protein